MAHLNSAEGIQNMCATQIMTKSKSIDIFFKDGVSKFLAQVHMRPKASCLLKSATFRCYSECTQINV